MTATDPIIAFFHRWREYFTRDFLAYLAPQGSFIIAAKSGDPYNMNPHTGPVERVGAREAIIFIFSSISHPFTVRVCFKELLSWNCLARNRSIIS